MPRIARPIAVGYPHHIVHRGNNRQKTFFDSHDFLHYLHLLNKYSYKWGSPILAYCLMTNHIHLLARPEHENSLYKMMQGAALCYTQYFNRKYRQTGQLWEGRYYSSIVGEEDYLWAVVRYIEQNPRRAGMVKREGEYRYSSARAHVEGIRDEFLGEELFGEWQRKQYVALLREISPRKISQQIRDSARMRRPFGSDEFMKRIGQELDRDFAQKPMGRPWHKGNIK